jgi:molybdopterin-guanine dinucleotide biosynthesis protein B
MKAHSPVFGVTGWKNSGKTTLTAALISEFTRRGYRVASVKHAHHAFDIDTEGTDSYRHRAAGAGETAIVGGSRWAIMHELKDAPEPELAEVLGRLSPCDIVLIEGYKNEPIPKIECRRTDGRKDWPLPDEAGHIKALATDGAVSSSDAHGRPVFHLDQISAIADFIQSHLGLVRSDAPVRAEAVSHP